MMILEVLRVLDIVLAIIIPYAERNSYVPVCLITNRLTE